MVSYQVHEDARHLSLSRWNAEIQLDVRLLRDESGFLSANQRGCQWSNGVLSARSYVQPPTTENPEGSCEFDLVLHRRPLTNIFRFKLTTKNLEFLKQPVFPNRYSNGMTWVENGYGGIRTQAARVGGSYAVYHSSCPINWVGGTLYGCGKAFHIFRPRVVDSAGHQVWADLHVDVKNGILQVVLPWEFLNTAVYPIQKAAGLEFGYHTIGAGGDSNDNTVLAYSKAVGTPAVDGALTAIIAHGNDGGSVGSFMSNAIYSNSGGAPTSRLGANDTGVPNQNSISAPFEDWITDPVTYGSLVAGTQYWLGHRTPTAAGAWGIQGDTGASGDLQVTTDGPIPWPASPGALSSFNPRYSIYATFDASAPVTHSSWIKNVGRPRPFASGLGR